MSNCQVCGAPVKDNSRNCYLHAYTRTSSVPLAQYIHSLESRIESKDIPAIAEKFGVSIVTVYKHMRREGFLLRREWRRLY